MNLLRQVDQNCIECRILEALAAGRLDLAEDIARRYRVPMAGLQAVAWLPALSSNADHAATLDDRPNTGLCKKLFR